MKILLKFILTSLLLFSTSLLFAQQKLGDNLGNHTATQNLNMNTHQLLNTSGVVIGSAIPLANGSIALQIGSTNQAIVISSVAANTNIVIPVNGMIIYNITDNKLYLYQAGAWVAIATGTISASAPNATSTANGLTVSALGVIALSPADATNPGIITTGAQTLAGLKTFSGQLSIAGTTSGTTTIAAQTVAGAGTVTLPLTGTLATLNGIETLTTKTLVAPALGTPVSGVMTNVTGTALGLTVGNLAAGLGGQIPYQSAAGTTAMLANGTAGQVLQSNGTTLAPTWVAGASVREVADAFTATAAQTSFTLTQTPSANSKVKMYVNGVRISAQSTSGTTLTYAAASNGGYALVAGDRIEVDYYY